MSTPKPYALIHDGNCPCPSTWWEVRPGGWAWLACRRGETAVKRALKGLQAKGAIVRKDGTGDGRGNPAVYTVLPPPGATRPADTAPRFGRRLLARVNGALHNTDCAPLDPGRWLDHDDPGRGRLDAPFTDG